MADASSPWIVEVSEADFQKEVVERSRQVPVILDVWAPWCGPCRQLGPVLEKLAQEHRGAFVLARLNADRAPRLCTALRVQGIPAVFASIDGTVVNRFVGALPEPGVRKFIASILPTAADEKVAEAQLAEASDPAAARRLYEEVLAQEPGRQDALVGLARLEFQRGDLDRAEALLANVPVGSDDAIEGLRARVHFAREAAALGGLEAARAQAEARPGDLDARFALGRCLAAAGQYEKALETLLSIVAADKRFGGGAVREAMVRLFHIVGSRSALADRYRSELARLLY